jgi:hypothetical protein
MGLGQTFVLKLIQDFTAALDYLIYRLKFVHKDIKPSYTVYNEHSYRFILADFELPIHFDPDTLQYDDVVCGTQEFILPKYRYLLNYGRFLKHFSWTQQASIHFSQN